MRLLAVISKLKVTVYVIALIEILYTVNFTFLQIIGGYNNGKMDLVDVYSMWGKKNKK